MIGYDVIGSIAILKFPQQTNLKEKRKRAEKLLKEHRNIKTALEKVEKVKGRLRTYKTRYLAGEKTKETIHKENGCIFKLNVEKCYFSPRLSNERLEIAGKCSRENRVLVLFAGVAPFSIVIAKIAGSKVVNVELGKECCKYARENVKLNKLKNVEIIQGNAKNLKKLVKGKFDKIVMPRPQIKEAFLEYVWEFCKKGTNIYYYDFGSDIGNILKKIYIKSKKARKKIEVIKVKKAGEIAPYRFRFRVDLQVY